MGSVLSSISQLFGGQPPVAPVEKGDGIGKDLRRRNSMTFHITKFLTHDDDDYTDLLDMVKDEFEARLLGVNSNSRDQSMYILCAI